MRLAEIAKTKVAKEEVNDSDAMMTAADGKARVYP
jgi:hypothetical protein